MGSKTRLSSYCTKRANNGVNLVTSRKMNTRLARPIEKNMEADLCCTADYPFCIIYSFLNRHNDAILNPPVHLSI